MLDAKTFSDKLKATSNAVLLDVRTPEEFSKEYIEGALLADWNSDDFQRRIDAIDTLLAAKTTFPAIIENQCIAEKVLSLVPNEPVFIIRNLTVTLHGSLKTTYVGNGTPATCLAIEKSCSPNCDRMHHGAATTEVCHQGRRQLLPCFQSDSGCVPART